MNENPWQVDSVQAFAFLNCPECTFKTREETFFQVDNFVTIFCFASTLAMLIPMHRMARANPNKSKKLVTNTTAASKYITYFRGSNLHQSKSPFSELT